MWLIISSGFDSFLSKPIDYERLEKLLFKAYSYSEQYQLLIDKITDALRDYDYETIISLTGEY